MAVSIKSRIAPSPSGYLHLGNAFNFLLTVLLVDFKEGHLHLRIDDFDSLRLKSEAVEDIFVQLDWLGIEYDSGPSGPDEFYSKYSQKLYKDYYFDAIEKIIKKKLIYACKCSRSKIRQSNNPKNYPGTCLYKNIDLRKEDISLRVHVPKKTSIKYKNFFNTDEEIKLEKEIGDFVIKRRDGLPSYQIISLVDDLEQGTNLIVRGQDLIPSTGAQLFLAKALDGKIFLDSQFVHHKLIKNNKGEKLSKSFGDLSLKVLKEKYRTPEFIFQLTAKFLNIPFVGIKSLNELKESFKTAIIKKNCNIEI